MSFDRQTARDFFGKSDARPAAGSDMNAVNPGIDEHGDLYARLSRQPKASAALPVLAGLALVVGIGVIVMTQMGDRINAEDIAAPSVSTSVTNSSPVTTPQ